MRVFVAGATGATGSVFVPTATEAGYDLVLHVRPQSATKSPLANDPRARVFDLSDEASLTAALAGCDAVVSFVGTMRDRFRAGDTYESADVGSTKQLVAGAIQAHVPRLLLLSSVGAGGAGAYLRMKGECERIVTESPLRWTIFRPSMLVTPKGADPGTHGERKAVPGLDALFSGVRAIPGLTRWADDVRPIPLSVLARAFVRVLAEAKDGQVLKGGDLWELGRDMNR